MNACLPARLSRPRRFRKCGVGHLPSRCATALLGLGVLLLGLDRLGAQKIDLNGNGVSDIWEAAYNAAGLDPNADTDGDGVINRLEALAGTDPFNSNSAPRISFGAYSPTNFSVSIPCGLGKQYQLQSTTIVGNVLGTNWTSEATQVARNGTVATLAAPVTATARYFRIAISDVDSDSDGVNDWEECQLGLDALKTGSNGQLDGNGQVLGDYAYATNRLASQNVVSIGASDPVANQPDPGQTAVNSGVLMVTRGGFPLNAITVNLGLGAPGAGVGVEALDYATLPRLVSLPVGVSSQPITVRPLANTNRLAPVIATMKVLAGAGYAVGSPSNSSVVIYPSATASGTGLTGYYYTNSSATYSSTNNFNSAKFMFSRTDPTVDFNWSNSPTQPFANSGYYTVRWVGQVQPQYSETYYLGTTNDDGVKLWVNGQLLIDDWTAHSARDTNATISLQGGVRYNIKMEYFNGGGSGVARLVWYSPSQAKQIIPSSRLYPGTNAATAVTSPLMAVAFVGQPFSYTVTGANQASSYSATGLPPGITNSPSTGLIGGTPTLAGDYQVTLTASNAVGVAASVLDLQVIDTGSAVTREVWTGVPGVNVADLPLTTPATLTNFISTLEGTTDYGDNYGERIRGYLTAPVTGNYYFWIAGSDSAELWVSNDSEPANKVRRAWVSPTNNPAAPPANGTGSRAWGIQTKQKSAWLNLEAGQRYYIEILHKAGVGPGDNWAVGWSQDPIGTSSAPGEVAPGYVLSKYFTLPASVAPGTLYAADMVTAPGVTNMGVGSATLRLSADNSRAILSLGFSGVPSGVIGEHINNEPYAGKPNQILFDISAARPQPDGTYMWPIGPVGTFSAADVLAILNEGKAYITILTADYPDGELNGHFQRVNGRQTFTPPPDPPTPPDDHASTNAAARFLIQATFGPSPSEVAAVQNLGYAGWISNQFSLPVTHHLPVVLANGNIDPANAYSGNLVFNTWWQQSITAPDQLRQRLAFALSEIMVVSNEGVLQDRGTALADYYDTLLDNALGNFRDLLRAVTLSPAMGLYLDMRANDKGSIITGIHANENYAREILQLFSVGLNRMWADGTLVLSSQGDLVPTYDQNVIMGFASVFTGWNYYQTNQPNGRLPTGFGPSANYTNSMVLVPTHHELGSKLLLDNAVLPPGWGTQTNSASPDFDTYCSQDLELALDSIFNNQNVGPFVCRQLIQRLVTSSPSTNYLYRVVRAFNDNGAGVRGDLQAVLKAILLDYEARSTDLLLEPTYGKQREPLLRVTAPARAFSTPSALAGTYSQSGTRTITVTTPTSHRVGTNETVWLNFPDPAPPVQPASQAYGITWVSPTVFTIQAPGLLTGTYTQAVNVTFTNIAGTVTNVFTTNAITVTISGHGLALSNSAYLQFSTGGALSAAYQVLAVPDSSHFIVATGDATSRSGNCLLPKWTGGGYSQLRTNVTFSTALPHGLSPGDSVFINFTAASSPADGLFQVDTVLDATHFTIIVPSSVTRTQNGQNIFPLIPPPVTRAGNVNLRWSTWAVNATDTGTASLAQTPLNSPTVFNFFFPDYKFQGPLATAGLTTPEFQLTSDTTVAWQMNFLAGGLLNNTGNTNGLSSFVGGAGAIALDLGPWMTPGYTSTAGLPGLVDALNSLLCAGQLSAGAKTAIVNYASTLAYTAPTPAQMRDRVRAVVHLIVTSPDFTIQR